MLSALLVELLNVLVRHISQVIWRHRGNRRLLQFIATMTICSIGIVFLIRLAVLLLKANFTRWQFLIRIVICREVVLLHFRVAGFFWVWGLRVVRRRASRQTVDFRLVGVFTSGILLLDKLLSWWILKGVFFLCLVGQLLLRRIHQFRLLLAF